MAGSESESLEGEHNEEEEVEDYQLYKNGVGLSEQNDEEYGEEQDGGSEEQDDSEADDSEKERK